MQSKPLKLLNSCGFTSPKSRIEKAAHRAAFSILLLLEDCYNIENDYHFLSIYA